MVEVVVEGELMLQEVAEVGYSCNVFVNRSTHLGGARGRGAPRGGARGGAKSGSKVVVEPHRHAGVFIARGKEDMLCTKNMVPGESVYGEKRISVDVCLLCF